jgi:hypothetical protein
MPHFFGNLYENNFWIANMPQSMPHYFLYAGILPWFLMLFISLSPETSRRLIIYCLILAFISLVLALGKYTPVYRLVYLLPGFDSFRGSSKIIALWMLALSILSAIGLDHFALFKNKNVPKGVLIFLAALLPLVFTGLILTFKPALSLKIFSLFTLVPISADHLSRAAHIICSQYQRAIILMAAAALLWYLVRRCDIPRKFLMPLCLCLLLGDLYQSNHSYIKRGDGAFGRLRDAKVQLSRTFATDKEVFRVGGIHPLYGPNDEMYYGLQTAAGAGPLILYRYYQYTDRFYGTFAPKGWQVYYYGIPAGKRFMDFLNVKYDIDYKKHSVAMRKDYLPRVLLVPGYEVMDASRILAYMDKPGFRPRKTVLLEEDPFPERKTPKNPPTLSDKYGTCHILQYRPNLVHLKVNAEHDAFLLLNDVYYPGWKCYVDGKPQKILRGNYLFRVIRIGAGQHDILFDFRPYSVTLGIIVSFFTILFSILIIIFERKKASPTSP